MKTISGWYAMRTGGEEAEIGPYETRKECLEEALANDTGLDYEYEGPGHRFDITTFYAEKKPIDIMSLFNVDDLLECTYYSDPEYRDVNGEIPAFPVDKKFLKLLNLDIQLAIFFWQQKNNIEIYRWKFDLEKQEEEITLIIPKTKSPIERFRCWLAQRRIQREIQREMAV